MPIDLVGNSRPAAAAVAQLNTVAHDLATEAGLTPLLVELVQIRASQLNGCAHCLRAHIRKAGTLGETPERLGLVAAWREAGYFDEAERAALELTEAITFVADGQVPEELITRVRKVLTEEQYTAVAWLAIAINTYNRVFITGHPAVKP
ncbi:carboxymuconolactone decarboxylase family protein [Dactylosporangium sp. NPDC000521]|uniref:carboxymuconolactone decarboxylase family protein n=1 Tax=Dactylosporangium sp. NPDC000521 TaxID=3363975 RepID=UPI003680615C